MKKCFLFTALCGLLFCAGCATGGSGGADLLSLDEAIEQSAEELSAKLGAGTRLAIVAFEAENDQLAGYVMDELTGSFANSRIEVADRNNLEYAYKELKFQMTGNVSDATALSLGKFLGAKYVITGQLLDTGGRYRYRVNAINVETAAHEGSVRLNVRNDRVFKNLLAAIRRGNPVTHAANYTGTMSSKRATAGTYLDRGLRSAGGGDYESAIEDFSEAINLDPDYTAAYFNRGILYGIKDGYDYAIADFNQAIRLDPDYAMAYFNRGYAYNHQKDSDRAIADFNQAINLDPNLALAYNHRGLAYMNKSDYDRAIADYTQALRLNPAYTYAYYNRGNAYYMKADYQRAIADYTQALKLDPDYPEAKKMLEEARKKMQ